MGDLYRGTILYLLGGFGLSSLNLRWCTIQPMGSWPLLSALPYSQWARDPPLSKHHKHEVCHEAQWALCPANGLAPLGGTPLSWKCLCGWMGQNDPRTTLNWSNAASHTALVPTPHFCPRLHHPSTPSSHLHTPPPKSRQPTKCV